MKTILLHGLGQNASSWNDTIESLDKRLYILCPDLYKLPHGQKLNYPNLYKAFSRYCEGLTEPFQLCGLSLGGILALQYGIENPDRIRSLVLIGTQFVMPRTLLKLQNALFRFMPDRAFQGTGLDKQDFIGLSKSMMDLDFRPELDKIACPVLIICGEKDHANMKAAAQLKNLLPHAELLILERVGHEVNLQAPIMLGDALNAFYSRQGLF